MTIKYFNLKNSISVLTIIAFVTIGCGERVAEKGNEKDTTTVDSTLGTLLKVNGEIFSIPSPIQTAFLIKQSGANYNKSMLNAAQKSSTYTTNFKKALNIGIYGADLGYVTIYDQTQDAISYLNSVKKLADELGVAGAFDVETLSRFQKNIGNKDSLLQLVAIAYRSSDTYLKNNERNDVSALILVGGWVESLYFANQQQKSKSNEEVKRRIAQQKNSLQSLIKLLTPYREQAEYVSLIDQLKDLATVFNGVEFKYTYVKPTVDAEKKLTTINNQTEVKINQEQLEAIYQKIQAIRNQIVG